MPDAAALYCRLSYAPNGELEKVERQEEDCRNLAGRLGWGLSESHIHRDPSRSAWRRDRKRPGWDALLEAVRRREVDSIIVYHGDRMVRQPWDLELLLRLADDRQIQLASVSGVRDLTNPDDRFVLRIEAAQACKSSDDTSRRVRRGWEARAKSGHPSGGGKRPFGFIDLTTPDPRESAILAEAADRFLSGESLNSVAAWMSTIATTSEGNPFATRSLKHLLTAPRIAGLVQHGENLYEAVWDPVISRGQWEDISAMLASNAVEHPYPGGQTRYLLSAIATCGGGCGEGLRAKPSGGRNRKTKRLYACFTPGCRAIGRDQYYLDEYVIGRVLRRLSDSDLMDGITEEDDDGAAAEIVSLERRKAETQQQLDNLADHPTLNLDMLARSLESFDRKIAELRDRRAASTRSRLLARMAGMTRGQWDDQPLDVRRATVKALFTITVLPTKQRGPGFDENAVRIEPI